MGSMIGRISLKETKALTACEPGSQGEHVFVRPNVQLTEDKAVHR
jgi:hypothetical protein